MGIGILRPKFGGTFDVALGLAGGLGSTGGRWCFPCVVMGEYDRPGSLWLVRARGIRHMAGYRSHRVKNAL